jgi:hypothetical protein
VALVVSFEVIDNDDVQVNHKIGYDNQENEQAYFSRIDEADRY